jgi:Flp pilus assembly protein CpaB
MHRSPTRPRLVGRAVLARRRPLAAVCAAVAVTAALRVQAAPPPARIAVVTAARDVPAGVPLRPDDLTRTGYDPASVPSGVVDERAAVGRATASPLRAGEPVTDVRLVAPGLLGGYPGRVAVPVRIGDAAAVRLLRVGDRVDLLAADPRGARAAAVLARDAPVLAIPSDGPDSRGGAGIGAGVDAAGATTGALVLLALPDDTAAVAAQAAVTAFLSVVLTR